MDTGNSFLFIGQLPTWLQGILLRNGPGMHTIGDSKYNHWFDGLALLHSFTFKNGKLLHIGLKGTQHPTFWCLMLLTLFWVGVFWVLSAECCVWGGDCCGEVSPHTPSHLTLHSSSWSVSAGLFAGRCHIVLSSAVPKFSVVVTPRAAQTQLWAGHCRAAFAFHSGQEILWCFKWISHKYPEVVLLWMSSPVAGRTSIPLLGFGCSYNSCQERNWATVSLHMSNLT